MYMKKSVLHIFKVLICGLVILCLSSCTGLIQKTGSVSFEIGPELLNAARAGGDPDEEFVRIVVALEGNRYGIKQTVDIPFEKYMSSMNSDRRFEATFDNIPVGKKLYAVIKTYQMMPGNTLPLELRDPELYGKSDYFTVKAGQNTVSINAADYRRQIPFSYNDTPVVTFSKNSSFYFYELSSGFNCTVNNNSFCFDNDGYFYTLEQIDQYAYRILSNNPSISEESSINHSYSPSLIVDSKTNIMYSYYFYAGDVYITKYPELISSNISENKEEKTIDSLVVTIDGGPTYACYPKSCTINNGIVYIIASYSEDGVYLFTVPFENISLIAKEKIEIPTGEIKDIIYMDGSIYFLINHFGNTLSGSSTQSPYGYYSRGALVKYNISDGSIRTLGWTSEPINNSGKYIYISAAQGSRKLYEDSNCLIPFKVSTKDIEGESMGGEILFPSFYAPAGKNNTSHFYGPQKIIGIKPKKLIIADNGVAFYTDSDNAYNAKNVNRIVTVDLETFAITNVADAPNGVTFEPDLTGDINTSAFAYVKNIMEEGKTYYESEDVEYINTYEYAPLFAYIPLEQ